MDTRRTVAAVALAAAALSSGLATATPASAGGVGDFLSPAFGDTCVNEHVGAKAVGATTRSTGTGGGTVAGIPIVSPVNQCGGADLPLDEEGLKKSLYNRGPVAVVLNPAGW